MNWVTDHDNAMKKKKKRGLTAWESTQAKTTTHTKNLTKTSAHREQPLHTTNDKGSPIPNNKFIGIFIGNIFKCGQRENTVIYYRYAKSVRIYITRTGSSHFRYTKCS